MNTVISEFAHAYLVLAYSVTLAPKLPNNEHLFGNEWPNLQVNHWNASQLNPFGGGENSLNLWLMNW